MDDVIADSKRVAANARLPSFITGTSLAAKLGWVPSLQRLFRQHVQSHPVPGWTTSDGDLYSSIVELLRLPSGLAIFEDRVAGFDSKKRGLLKALFDAGWRQLPPDTKLRPRSSFALMSTLIRQEAWDLAGWMAWGHLEIADLRNERRRAKSVYELVESHSELALRLGDYWTQEAWLRGPDDEVEKSMSQAAPIGIAGSDSVELRWREEIAELGRLLSEATIGEDISRELAAASERLSDLRKQWAALGAASLQARREIALAALADTLRAAEPPLSVAGRSIEQFIDILSRELGIDDAKRLDEVDAALNELRRLAGDALVAAKAEDEAKAVQAREDSDVADEAYATARSRRRKAAQALVTFVDAQLPGLLADELPKDDKDDSDSTGPAAASKTDGDIDDPDDRPPTSIDAVAGRPSLEPVAEEDAIEPGPGSEAAMPHMEVEASVAERCELAPPQLQPATPGLAEASLQAPLEMPSGSHEDPLDAPIEAAVVQALIAKRYGLAYHLAAAAQEQGLGVDLAPLAVLEALAVGASAGAARLIPAASRYKTLQEDVLLAMDASSTPSTRLAVFAGALRPALFAPDSSGVEILGRANLGDYGAGLHELCQFVTTEIRGRGLNLTPADFAPATADGDRRAAEVAARKTLLDFAATAPSRRLKFHRAITIWTDVFRQGPVAEAIAAVEKKASNAPALSKAAEGWIYEDTAEQRVDLLDAAHRTRKDRPLEAGVRLRLADWLRQTAQHLRHWVEAYEACERTRGEHVLEKLHELRRHLQAAHKDLVSVANNHPQLRAPVQAAVDVVTDLLASSNAAAESPLTLEMVLNDDLLLFDPPILRRGAERSSAEEVETIIRQGPAIAAGAADFEGAFHAVIKAGRFGAARQILERLVSSDAALAPLAQALKASADAWTTETTARAEKLRGKIDDLLGADQLARIDVSLSARLDGLLTVLRAETGAEDTQLDFAELDVQLKEIEADVRNGFEILLIPLRERIDELKARGRNTTELEEMAEHHDLATLVEHIDAALNDVDWTAKRVSGLLEHFAGHCLTDEYERIPANERSIAELIRAAEARKRTAAADFSALDPDEAERARELLTAWRELRNPQARRESALTKLMQALGFTSAEVKDNGALGKAQGAPRRMTLHTDKIADREICRVPAFGSEANGRYMIILAEPSAVKTGEELTGWLDQLTGATTTPTLIVVAGHLPLKSRNLFMSAVRRRGGSASCGLIDEAMVVFLAAQPDRRRGHIFDLALPMGLVQPYADTAARTSQEMFYGRKSELDDLWDRNGSCLVYGGRQLGKTALLKQIQLRHNQPPAQLVIYGDLQAELPGANGHNIWPWLGRKLKGEAGFANRDMKNQAEVEAAIRAWLDIDSRRRLLVLVDEADEFLRQELINQYTSLAKIRDLMQATDRYCKFVFAGLHDVQRLARTPNSPLLHFGAPVRVGPLMGSDLPEARAMAEGPMATAGFVFKSSSLAGRMLSQVGYYPSLLQAFSKGLIERMNKSIGRRPGPVGSSLLPIAITERDLEETFQDRAFRENIQLKFENTLNLDERYRLITFIMLVDSLARRDQGALPIGLKDAELQRLALQWWPQGFAEDQSLDAFQGLLQEMIGLGVLIEQSDGRFVIRSARIADMLGGREQIERKLVELSDTEAPSRLDTGTLRRLCGTTPSPLTARQETMLLSEAKPASAVHLLASSRALGIDEVAISLSDIAETQVRVDRRSYQNVRQLEQAVEAAASSVGQKDRGLLVLSGPWLGTEMMTLAARNSRVRQAQKDGRYGMRVLLVPYDVDWRELDAAVDVDDIVSLSPLGENSLGQFVKRHWGAALGALPDEAQIKEIRRLTGGFPRFLHQPKGRTAAEMVETLRQRTEELYQSADLFALLGLDDDALRSALTVIAEVGYDAEVSDDLMRDVGIDDPQAALRHLERLGLVERHTSQQSYEAERRLNPLVEGALARRQV